MNIYKILFVLIAAAYIVYVGFGAYQSFRNKKFIKFIRDNKDEILYGGCEFNGIMYNSDTELVRYRSCVSVIFATFAESCAFYPVCDSHRIKIICNTITLLCGWWGIPWGPIKSVQAIRYNGNPEVIALGSLYIKNSGDIQ